MHPILARGNRLLFYLLVWLPVGGLLAATLVQRGATGWVPSLALAVPLVLFFGFLCLGVWYPCRSLPLGSATIGRAFTTHTLGAVLSSGLWLLAGLGWAEILARMGFEDIPLIYREQTFQLFAFGLLFYLLAVGGSYLYLALENTYAAERRALEAQQQRLLADRELDLARQLQARLLPDRELRAEALEVSARNLAAQGVAGDFYDYFTCADGWRLAVADVAGKGIAASLITATVKAMLPLLAEGRSVVEAMVDLNRRLAARLGRREFVALLLAAYDPRSRRLELVNAGLPDPYLLSTDGALRALEAPVPRLPLGLRANLEYESLCVELGPGDRVVFLTDGLPEAPLPDGEPLGYEALEEILRQHTESRGEGWVDRFLEAIQKAAPGDQEDDCTVLLLTAGEG